MKFFSSTVLALVAVSSAPSVRACVPEELITKLTFFDSVVTENKLHEPDGKLIFSNVGVYQNEQIDMVITSVDSLNPTWPYSNIEQVWIDRGKNVPNGNGKKPNGGFGQINLQTLEDEPTSGLGNFKFCLVSGVTGNAITLPSFQMTIYDIDTRKVSEKEKLVVDFNQPGYVGYQLPGDSELSLECENELEALPCPTSRTVFKAGTWGTGEDNPDDPDTLTDQQIARSVGFLFENTSCFQFTYDHYCMYDQPWYDGDTESCKNYSGGNFLFGGYSQSMIDYTTCMPVPEVSQYPSLTPTIAPTEIPTPHPTPYPTDPPTEPPTPDPTPYPTDPPTKAPTPDPTPYPTDPPTEPPTPDPTPYPTEPPTEPPTSPPTTAPPTAHPTDIPSASPTEDTDPVPPTPVTSPPSESPECPEDIVLIHTNGETPIGIAGAIQIVEQNTDTVVVQLTNSWVESSENIDQIFYQYKPDQFNEHCYHNSTVPGGEVYNEIEISCMQSKPFAELEICVADDDALLPGDDATVPQCCHNEEDSPAVCYILTINCETVCVEEVERRSLRGQTL